METGNLHCNEYVFYFFFYRCSLFFGRAACHSCHSIPRGIDFEEEPALIVRSTNQAQGQQKECGDGRGVNAEKHKYFSCPYLAHFLLPLILIFDFHDYCFCGCKARNVIFLQ